MRFALVLDALIIAWILAGVAVVREFESGTIALTAISPVHPFIPLLGRLLASSSVALLALLLAVGVVIFGYGVRPRYPLEMAAVLLAWGCMGARKVV